MSKSVRIDDDVLERVISEVPGKTLSDKLRALMESRQSAPATSGDSPAVLEILEHVRSQLDAETVHDIVEDALQRKIDERAARTTGQSNPASIPGVQVGAGNLRPRRESGYERAQREKLEAEQRVQDLDPVSDPSIVRDAEFVSG